MANEQKTIFQSEETPEARLHQFYAVAFEENFAVRQLAGAFPQSRVTPLELFVPIAPTGGLYIFPFGAAVGHDVPPQRREAELARLREFVPKLTAQVVREEYTVAEMPGSPIRIVDGMLRLDRFTPARAGIVALTMAQSVAMEYYERLVEDMFVRTGKFVERLETTGTVPLRTRPLHRFIGQAITSRTEVLSVLHLLDKPEAAWEDSAMDRIYADLRAEFDLADRYGALELKLRSIQEALELLVSVARDRQLLLLELTVVILILVEILTSVSWPK